MIDFKQIFDNYQATRQKTWEFDRKLTVGASEAFACIRKTGFSKRAEEFGYEEDPGHTDNWGAAERGNLIEDHWVVPAMNQELPDGVGYLYAGEDQKTFVSGLNSATPDGLVCDVPNDCLKLYGIDDIESDCFLLEIKSVDPRINLTTEKEIHHGQTQIQLALIRELTEFKPMYGVILYIDASFLDDINVFPIKYNKNAMNAAKMRANKVYNAESLEELEPEGKNSGECKFCSFTHACAKVSKEAIPTGSNSEIDQSILDAIYDLVVQEREADEHEKGWKEDKDRLRANIKQMMADVETKLVSDERYTVRWTFQAGRKTLDKPALEQSGVDLSKFETQGAGFEKMTIKLVDK